MKETIVDWAQAGDEIVDELRIHIQHFKQMADSGKDEPDLKLLFDYRTAKQILGIITRKIRGTV